MNKAEKDNLFIKNVILENKPFFIGRIAGCELKIAYNFLKGDLLDIVDELKELENNAGIKINNNDSLKKYVEELVESYKNCTVIAEWEITGKVFSYTGIGQQLMTSKTIAIPKIDARALEPYYFKNSWMPALSGKKILIVHPFLNTFKPCALKSMNVDYTASGSYATYEDATPVHMKLTLSFQELNPVYFSDYDGLTDNDGVGY